MPGRACGSVCSSILAAWLERKALDPSSAPRTTLDVPFEDFTEKAALEQASCFRCQTKAPLESMPGGLLEKCSRRLVTWSRRKQSHVESYSTRIREETTSGRPPKEQWTRCSGRSFRRRSCWLPSLSYDWPPAREFCGRTTGIRRKGVPWREVTRDITNKVCAAKVRGQGAHA